MPAKSKTAKSTATVKSAGTAKSAPAKKAAKSVAAKTTRSKVAAKAAVTVVAAPAVVAPAKLELTGEARYQLVKMEAYLIAEKDGFRGDPNGYWHAAEARVAALVGT